MNKFASIFAVLTLIGTSAYAAEDAAAPADQAPAATQEQAAPAADAKAAETAADAKSDEADALGELAPAAGSAEEKAAEQK